MKIAAEQIDVTCPESEIYNDLLALDEKLYNLIKRRFEQHIGDDGAHFFAPIRVDLLQK